MQSYGFQMPRAFGYCRKSTTGQREESIEAQQRAIVSYAAASGFELVKVYKDHGNSGRNGERPQFTQMVQDAINGGAQFIIVHKLDRFSRDRYDSVMYKRELERCGVRLLSVSENLDGSPESLRHNGSQQFSQEITDQIISRLKDVIAQEVRQSLNS